MIGGCGSSGTTLLAHLLNQHSTLYCGPELYVLNKRLLYTGVFPCSRSDFQKLLTREKCILTTGVLGVDLRPWSTHAKPLRADRTFLRHVGSYGISDEMLYSFASESRGFKEFLDRLFEVILASTGKLRWAEKTPTNCYCIEPFLSLYSAGRYIHVVRDGRDVVASLIQRGLSPEEALRRWLHDTATGLAFRGASRCYQVRYEDLVTQPRDTLARLMVSLDLDGDPTALIKKAQSSYDGRSHLGWNLRPGEMISTASIGKWKRRGYKHGTYLQQLFRYTVLPREVTRVMGLKRPYNSTALLRELGYDATDRWDSDPRVGSRLLRHFLSERACELLPGRRKTYCRVEPSSRNCA